MATSFGALCTDFYVNQKLALKMDLPSDRETILHLYEQVRKIQPGMDRFRRYDGELALESSRSSNDYRWMAIRRRSLRSGHVNPTDMPQAYEIHRLALETAPYHLTISPLDIDFVELMFGFDLECSANHDEVVFDALIAGSPMADLLRVSDAKILEVQPNFAIALNDSGDLQASYEVKTRTKTRRGRVSRRYRQEPISIFLTIRKYGPIDKINQLTDIFEVLTQQAERLATDQVVPNLLTPISRQITSNNT